jgi:hypothetical protein
MTPQMTNPQAGKALGAKANTFNYSKDILSELSPRLNKFKQVSPGRYSACCPVHNDDNPSLGITIMPNGKWVIHCLSCGAKGTDVCNALGIDVTLLFPPNDRPLNKKQQHSGFSARQMLIALEPNLVRLLIIANDSKAIGAISDDDRDFVSEVVIRINGALQYLDIGFSAWEMLTALESDLVRLLIIANDLKAINALSDDDRDFVSEVAINVSDALQYLKGKK